MARIPDEDVFLKRLREKDGASGNVTLIELLGWDQDKYWKVRDRLIDKGEIVKGPGRGGSVRIVGEAPAAEPRPASTALAVEPPRRERAEQLRPAVEDEAALYPGVAEVLKNEWGREERLSNWLVEITAKQGRRATGGTWTRPDITVVSKKNFAYVPHGQFDVWTFEVKTAEAIDVTGLFEAAAHSRRATRSYAMFQVPERLNEDQEQTLDRCAEEARRFRVGLITFTDPKTFATWDIRVLAPRLDTNAELVEEFIAEQLSDEAKNTILRWGR